MEYKSLEQGLKSYAFRTNAPSEQVTIFDEAAQAPPAPATTEADDDEIVDSEDEG